MTSLLPSRSVDRLTSEEIVELMKRLPASEVLDMVDEDQREELIAEAERVVGAELVAADPPLWMYVIQAGFKGPLKVGISRDPKKRMRDLQGSNAETLSLVVSWRALPVEEKGFHEEYADLRIQGEWFRPHPKLIQHARSYAIARGRLR